MGQKKRGVAIPTWKSFCLSFLLLELDPMAAQSSIDCWRWMAVSDSFFCSGYHTWFIISVVAWGRNLPEREVYCDILLQNTCLGTILWVIIAEIWCILSYKRCLYLYVYLTQRPESATTLIRHLFTRKVQFTLCIMRSGHLPDLMYILFKMKV